MIRLLNIFFLVGVLAHAEDGLFMIDDSRLPTFSVDKGDLVMRAALRKLEVPKAKRVILFDSAGSDEGRYTLQVDLTKTPDEGWLPILILGGDVVMIGVSVGRSESHPTLSFGTNDTELASRYHSRIGKLFGLSGSQVIDRRDSKVEPDAAREPPPAASVQKPSGNTNTNLQSEAPADGGGR